MVAFHYDCFMLGRWKNINVTFGRNLHPILILTIEIKRLLLLEELLVRERLGK